MIIAYIGALVIGAIILLADLTVGTAVVVTSISAVWLSVRGIKTTGHVVHVGDRRPGRKAEVRVSYETPSGRREIDGKSQRPQVGELVNVWYSPRQPAKATAVAHPWREAAIGIPVALWMGILAVGMVTGSVWYFSGTHAHLQLPVGLGSLGLAAGLTSAYGAGMQYVALLHRHRMTHTDGKVKQYDDHSPVGPGILVSFDSDNGPEKFWAQVGYVAAGVGDTVTVYYDPDKPATSATVKDASDVRNMAIFFTAFAVLIGGLSLWIVIGSLVGAG